MIKVIKLTFLVDVAFDTIVNLDCFVFNFKVLRWFRYLQVIINIQILDFEKHKKYFHFVSICIHRKAKNEQNTPFATYNRPEVQTNNYENHQDMKLKKKKHKRDSRSSLKKLGLLLFLYVFFLSSFSSSRYINL